VPHPLGLTITTWDDAELGYVEAHGMRWQLQGQNISRTDAEVFLGVWPGYLDGIEDLYEHVLEISSVLHQTIERAFIEAEQRWSVERHPELRRWRAQSPTDPEHVPEKLRHIRHLKQLKISEPAYIYFLLKKGEVVYVGQTAAPWPGRVLQHLTEGQKDFDDVWYIEVDRPSLDQAEQRFIEEFRPIHNRPTRLPAQTQPPHESENSDTPSDATDSPNFGIRSTILGRG
jgi:hypothetical protein